MADPHAQDPNAAPMHHDIKERFTSLQVALCGALGVAAIALGLVFAAFLSND